MIDSASSIELTSDSETSIELNSQDSSELGTDSQPLRSTSSFSQENIKLKTKIYEENKSRSLSCKLCQGHQKQIHDERDRIVLNYHTRLVQKLKNDLTRIDEEKKHLLKSAKSKSSDSEKLSNLTRSDY